MKFATLYSSLLVRLFELPYDYSEKKKQTEKADTDKDLPTNKDFENNSGENLIAD